MSGWGPILIPIVEPPPADDEDAMLLLGLL